MDRAEEAQCGGPERVFLIAGEASGDWSGSLLARALRKARPEVRLEGIGGRRMAAAGVEVRLDSSGWGAIGFFEGVCKVPSLVGALRGTLRLHRRSLWPVLRRVGSSWRCPGRVRRPR